MLTLGFSLMSYVRLRKFLFIPNLTVLLWKSIGFYQMWGFFFVLYLISMVYYIDFFIC